MPRSQRNLSLSQLRVGIFILVALLILGFMILNSSGDFNPFEKKFKLRARFVSADGLHPNAQVQLAGVDVGKVEDVKFLPPDPDTEERIEATMSVVRELDGKPITDLIRTDSTAQLVATSVLGNDKMINISPGSGKAAAITENSILESSSPIGINQLTETGNDLLKQINKIAVPANEILNKANQGEGTLGRIINDEALYRNLDATVNETRSTMLRLQTTLDKVNRGQGTAGKLLSDPALYNSLNKTVAQLEAISADLASGKGSAGRFLKDEQLYDDARDTLARFNSTATKLESLITDAQAGKGTLGRLVTDETLFNNVNQTAANFSQLSSESTKLIYDFRQNPKKYLRIKLSLF